MKEVEVNKEGRVTLPADLRRKIGIENLPATVKIEYVDNALVIKPINRVCVICGNDETVETSFGNLCPECINRIKNL